MYLKRTNQNKKLMFNHSQHHELTQSMGDLIGLKPLIGLIISATISVLAFIPRLFLMFKMDIDTVYFTQVLCACTGTACSVLTLFFAVILPMIRKAKKKDGE